MTKEYEVLAVKPVKVAFCADTPLFGEGDAGMLLAVYV
jgi:hypothetical protein